MEHQKQLCRCLQWQRQHLELLCTRRKTEIDNTNDIVSGLISDLYFNWNCCYVYGLVIWTSVLYGLCVVIHSESEWIAIGLGKFVAFVFISLGVL